jgi:hypothetical protein
VNQSTDHTGHIEPPQATDATRRDFLLQLTAATGLATLPMLARSALTAEADKGLWPL